MAKVIICIHGLGNKPTKELLSLWWRISIREGLRGIDKYIFNPKIEMVYWADVLHEQPLDAKIKDPKNPLFLNDIYKPSPDKFVPEKHDVRKKVLGFIEKQMDKLFLNDDQSINYSFISDYIIHKYFSDLEIYYDCNKNGKKNNCARDKIRNKLVDLLDKHKHDKIFLIAHSMGSIIAYDVMILKFSETKIDTFVTIGSPLGIPIVMSKIATELKSSLNNSQKLSTPECVQNNWYNFSDLEDKVAMNYNLSDDYLPNKNGIRAIDFEVHNDYILNGEKNPHKAYGYLRTPEFSNILFEFLMKDRLRISIWFLTVINNLYRWSIGTTINLLKKLYRLQSGKEYEP